MKIEVTSCHDCPFCNNDHEDGRSCRFPGNDVDEGKMPSYDEEWIPRMCPLLDTSVIVQKANGVMIK